MEKPNYPNFWNNEGGAKIFFIVHEGSSHDFLHFPTAYCMPWIGPCETLVLSHHQEIHIHGLPKEEKVSGGPNSSSSRGCSLFVQGKTAYRHQQLTTLQWQSLEAYHCYFTNLFSNRPTFDWFSSKYPIFKHWEPNGYVFSWHSIQDCPFNKMWYLW